MLMPHTAWIVYLLALTFSGCSTYPVNRVTKATKTMTVCQLYNHRTFPPKGEVRVRATTFTDIRHGSILVDPNCPSGETIAFRFANGLSPNSTAMQFKRALDMEPMQLELRVFRVDAVGKLQRASQSNAHGLFYIDKVYWFRPVRQ